MTNKEKYKNLSDEEMCSILYEEGTLCDGCVGEHMTSYATGLCEGIWCNKQLGKLIEEEAI